MKTISPEQETALCARWRDGDRSAGHEIIEYCKVFTKSIALEYRKWGVPLDDLLQEGNIGLLKAAERFDPSRSCRLVTYASFWIRAQIREYVAQNYRIVRLGASKGERKLLRLHRRTTERDPGVLAVQTGLSRDRVLALLPVLNAGDVSLDFVTPDGDTKLERLADSAPSPEEDVGANDDMAYVRVAVRKAIESLPPRERALIEARWCNETSATLESFGVKWGISRERVRQIEERAKERIREQLSFDATIRAIAPYVDRATRHDGQ